MLIIKQTPLSNGAYQNQIGTFTTIPDGYIEIPADLEAKAISYLPFIKLTIKDGIVTTVSQGKIPDKSIIEVRTTALSALDGKCSGSIYQGLDIGTYHYNFTPTSQTNLETIARLIASGQKKFLYRADNEMAQREYSDTEMNVIIRTKDEWITINTNYYELLKTWINRESDIAIIESIDYGNQLPADLMQELATRCNVVGIDITKYANLFN